MSRLWGLLKPENDREAVFLIGILLLAVGFALWWVPGAFIIPGAILAALGIFAREVTEE